VLIVVGKHPSPLLMECSEPARDKWVWSISK